MNTVIDFDFHKVRQGHRLAFDGIAPSSTGIGYGAGCTIIGGTIPNRLPKTQTVGPESIEARIEARLGFTDGAVQFAFVVDEISCGNGCGATYTITGDMPNRFSRTRTPGIISVETRIVVRFGLTGKLQHIDAEFVYSTPQKYWVESHEGSLRLEAFSE